MNDITIITAFFDIGRSTWTPDKGLPHYLHRSNETYLERFGIMAKLNNEMVIYTTEEFADIIQEYRKGKEDKTQVVVLDFKNSFKEMRLAIAEVQTNENYQKMISPTQRLNPEYWSADYVLVNALKSHFVNKAISDGYVNNEMVAWIDFGYCRNGDMLGGHHHWNFNFNQDKIHFFQQREWDPNKTIQHVISNNEVHMLGAKIIASKQMWSILEKLIFHSLELLLQNNMVDDDQTLMLMSYLFKPELFELHKIVQDDSWIVHNSVFKEYNI